MEARKLGRAAEAGLETEGTVSVETEGWKMTVGGVGRVEVGEGESGRFEEGGDGSEEGDR